MNRTLQGLRAELRRDADRAVAMARQLAGVQLDYRVHSFPDLSRFLISHSGPDDDEMTKAEVVRAFGA